MKVLLIVIDAASPRVVCPAIKTGRLPVLQKLAAAGSMHEASATIFPSITPAATTSIVTGVYPAGHGIAGASWFEESRDEVAYYGDDFWVIAREGFGEFVRDFLVRLNGDRLTAPTLFELVERAGKTAACLNYLVFKGIVPYTGKTPTLLKILPGVPAKVSIQGPSVFCMGDFVSTRTLRGRKLEDKGGVLHRFGLDDESTGALLAELLADRVVPDLTVAYFPDNDYRSHEVGPHAALETIEGVDRALGNAFDAAGGLDRLLRDTCVIVTSDHGHCEVLADPDRSVVKLDEVLAEFRQASLGKPWGREDEVMICPNMRAAQIYVREPTFVRLDRVIHRLLADPRVDQVLWPSHLKGGRQNAYAVRGGSLRLEFWRGDDGPSHARDAFGTPWSWTGDLGVVDGHVADGAITFGDYPNAFERIAGSLDSRHHGELWATAVPGCDFQVPGGSAHVGGGSHGALHALDSLSPLIVAGAGQAIDVRHPVRSVDIAPLCMQVLGLTMKYGVGDPRQGE